MVAAARAARAAAATGGTGGGVGVAWAASAARAAVAAGPPPTPPSAVSRRPGQFRARITSLLLNSTSHLLMVRDGLLVGRRASWGGSVSTIGCAAQGRTATAAGTTEGSGLRRDGSCAGVAAGDREIIISRLWLGSLAHNCAMNLRT